MVSSTSKTLPFISLAIGFGLSLLSIFGYGEQAENALQALLTLIPILVPTSVGGIVVKQIEEANATKRRLLEGGELETTVKKVLAEIEAAKKPPA